jgi:hypothetical protein
MSRILTLNNFLSCCNNDANIFYQSLQQKLTKYAVKKKGNRRLNYKNVIFSFQIEVSKKSIICCFINFNFSYTNIFYKIDNVLIIFDCNAKIKYDKIPVSLGKTCLFYSLSILAGGKVFYSKIELLGNKNCFKKKISNKEKIGKGIIDIVKLMNVHFGVTTCSLQDASSISIYPKIGKKDEITISLKNYYLYTHGKTWYEKNGFVSIDNNMLTNLKTELNKIKLKNIINQNIKILDIIKKDKFILQSDENKIKFKSLVISGIEDFINALNDIISFSGKNEITYIEAINILLESSKDKKTGKLLVCDNLETYEFIETMIMKGLPFIKQKIINKKNYSLFGRSISDIMQEINYATEIMEIKY